MPVNWRPLAAHLAAQPSGVGRVTLTLPEIEALVGGPLPPSAGTQAAWMNAWGNARARLWLAAGWHVAARAMRRDPPAVTFARGAPPSFDTQFR